VFHGALALKVFSLFYSAVLMFTTVISEGKHEKFVGHTPLALVLMMPAKMASEVSARF